VSAPTGSIAWNNRIFGGVGIAPIWVGIGLALVFSALLVGAVQWSGELATFMKGNARWWEDRNARVALVLVLMAAYLPTARRYEWLGFARDLDDLGRTGIAKEDPDTAWNATAASAAGALGLVVVPILALSVDRDLSLYLRGDYWVGSNIFIWAIGAFTAWHGGVFFYAIRAHANRLSRAARETPVIRLFHLENLVPFSRYGLRCALLWSLILAIWAFNLIDRGFTVAIGWMASLSGFGATLAVLLPLRGVRDRIRVEKRAELARVDAALEGDSECMQSSALRQWPGPLSIADLLAYRSHVERSREWPLDPPAFARFGLYLLIPLGSWLGGALVERLVDALVE